MEDKKRVKSVGKYELVSRIGEGGMGVVYKAKHPTLGRYVLLKRLAVRGGAQFTERFKREATLLMDFKHDAIVQVYDHFKEGSYTYIVEEFIDGISLEALIKRERYLSNEAAMLILYETARALKYAHDKGVVHRDIKPGNILISHKGEVKLVDFGIATPVEGSEDSLTRDGMTLGTPGYIPPEQIGNAGNADKRADIYSLGVVLYEALTGKTPFPGLFNADTIAQIQKGRYIPAGRLNPKISPLLRRIIRKCIRPRRRRRYQDLHPILRMVGRRLRRRDPASIREAVRKVLKGEGTGGLIRTRGSALAWSLGGAALLCALAAGAWRLYERGAAHEWLLAGKYGAMVAAVRVPPGYKPPGEVAARAIVYREREGELVQSGTFLLEPAAGADAQKGYTLESRRAYLPEGRYRVKLMVEGELAWFSFYLQPRVEQRKHLDTVGEKRIQADLPVGGGLPLTVRWAVTDMRSGADLTASTNVAVGRGAGWLALTPEVASTLRSGSAYRFLFERPGYTSQVYNLLVRPYESRLFLDVELSPAAGILSVTSDTAGLEILLNDSARYLAGGSDRGYRDLDSLTAGTRDLVLDPGEYRLTVRRGSRSRTIPVVISSDRTTRVSVGLDRRKNELTVTAQP
jgi:serine/threonine-protein kinase